MGISPTITSSFREQKGPERSGPFCFPAAACPPPTCLICHFVLPSRNYIHHLVSTLTPSSSTLRKPCSRGSTAYRAERYSLRAVAADITMTSPQAEAHGYPPMTAKKTSTTHQQNVDILSTKCLYTEQCLLRQVQTAVRPLSCLLTQCLIGRRTDFTTRAAPLFPFTALVKAPERHKFLNIHCSA